MPPVIGFVGRPAMQEGMRAPLVVPFDKASEAGPAKHLGNLDLAHTGTDSLQPLDGVADKVGELVDRFPKLYQGFGPLFVNPFDPRGDGRRSDQELLGRLFQGPAVRRLEQENGHSLGRGVVRPVAGIESGHSGVLDADFFRQLGHLLLEPLTLGLQADARIDAVGCPPTRVGHPELSQGDHVEHGRLDVGAPAFR